MILNVETLNKSLGLLEKQLHKDGKAIELVVCGGSALISLQLVSRVTKDIDILAIIDGITHQLIDPDPLPKSIIDAKSVVKEILNLPEDWLNTGPADLFRMGLPHGFTERLSSRQYGSLLTVHFISRLDQIHFKLYASVDRGGYHIEDLLALSPTTDEIIMASK